MPTQMPNRCGTVRRNPKFTPEASSMVLFGPGVIDDTSTKAQNAINTLEPGKLFERETGRCMATRLGRKSRESGYAHFIKQYRYSWPENCQY
ncbi:hypothetical protein GCM10009080_05930 [Cupriavidus pauculus]